MEVGNVCFISKACFLYIKVHLPNLTWGCSKKKNVPSNGFRPYLPPVVPSPNKSHRLGRGGIVILYIACQTIQTSNELIPKNCQIFKHRHFGIYFFIWLKTKDWTALVEVITKRQVFKDQPEQPSELNGDIPIFWILIGSSFRESLF